MGSRYGLLSRMFLVVCTTLTALIIAGVAALAADAPPEPVDLIAANNNQGLIDLTTQKVFGPSSCAAMGDPFSPLHAHSSSDTNPNRNLIDPPGVYSYRIAIPDSYLESYNLVRVELFDPQTGNLKTSTTQNGMNLAGSWDYPGGDPTVYSPTNVENLSPALVPITAANTCLNSSGQDDSLARQDACALGGDAGTSGAIDPANPFWFVRMDENRGPCFTSGGYDLAFNGRTEFILYYYKQEPGGQLTRVNLARYTGMADDGSTANWYKTALMWVSPGAPAVERMPAYTSKQVAGSIMATTAMAGSPAEPATAVDACPPAPGGTLCSGNGDFIVNLNPAYPAASQPANETANIYQDPTTHTRYLYLDVQSISGSSGNSYSIWAGPALTEDPAASAPAFVNARQIYTLKQAASGNTAHATHGLTVYAMDRMPLSNVGAARKEIPIADLGPEYAGAEVAVRLFDVDEGATPPVQLYFDNIPKSTWSACWGDGSAQCRTKGSTQAWQYQGTTPNTFGDICNTFFVAGCGQWSTFFMIVPSASDLQHPAPFNGGHLMLSLTGARSDTYAVWITVGQPGVPSPVSPTDGATVQGIPTYRWSASANAAAYQLQYADNANFTNPLYSDEIYATQLRPDDQAAGTYYWHVRARNAVRAWSAWSSPRSVTIAPLQPPEPPAGLTATAASPTRVDLSWTDGSFNAGSFHIERSENGTEWQEIGATGSGETSFSDVTLSCNLTRSYRVFARNAAGDSAPTEPVTVTTPICIPAAPSDLSATRVSTTQIDLIWTDNSDDETGFRIERLADTDSNWKLIGTMDANVTGYTDTNPPCGELGYRIRAINAGGGSEPSNAGSATAIVCPPAAPSGLVATGVSGTQIDLRWVDNSDNETGFKIERSPTRMTTWTVVATVGAGVTRYSDSSGACNSGYYYRVTATNAGGDSRPTDAVIAGTLGCPPAAPSDLIATAVSRVEIDLSWTDNSPDETGFKIERSPGGAEDWSLLYTTGPNETYYRDGGLTCGTGYDYRVIATSALGDSSPAAASATTVSCSPGAPNDLIATAVSRTEIDLAWVDNSDDETGFRIERSAAGAGDWLTIGTVDPDITAYSNSGLTCGTGYDYRVIASSTAGDSEPSNQASATTDACLMGTPGRVTITTPDRTLLTNDPNVTFGWTAAANADTYRIQISTSSRFKTTVVDQAGIADLTTTASLADGVYYARVQAVNSLGVAGKWSAARKVTVDTTPPPVPMFKAVAGTLHRPVLMVFKSPGAVIYQFEVSSDAGLMADATLEEPTLKIDPELPPGTYRWRVRAWDRADNASEWSDYWDMTKR